MRRIVAIIAAACALVALASPVAAAKPDRHPENLEGFVLAGCLRVRHPTRHPEGPLVRDGLLRQGRKPRSYAVLRQHRDQAHQSGEPCIRWT